MKSCFLKSPALLACVVWAAALPVSAQSSPYRGLWVGEAVLGGVNEVSVPLDAEGVARAPDSKVVTPTYDAANLRLIIHVDASGRASLLKHVAILARNAGVQAQESDLALVTDERLYGDFPPQPATRISSVVFDFGDAMATTAVTQVVERAAAAAATAAGVAGATEATIRTAAQAAAAPVIGEADAAAAFTGFLQSSLNEDAVMKIAEGDTAVAAAARSAATQLRDGPDGDGPAGSFYQDPRGVEMLDAIERALAEMAPAATTAQRHKVALNTAAAFVETDLAADRFLAGGLFGDALEAAAAQAATTAGGIALKPITAFQASAGAAVVTALSSAHGLVTGDTVAIQGAAVAAYNGLHNVVRLDDNSFRIAAAAVSGGAIGGYSAQLGIAPLRVTSVGHGLTSGARVTIRDSLASYNGQHVVTVLDADTFSVELPFESDPAERGTWSARSGQITRYEGTADQVRVVTPNHGLDSGQSITIRGAGAYDGVKTITRIDADSFSLAQTFAGNPAAKGTWDIPVTITGLQAPAVVPTLVAAPNHRLASGDRIVIAGSGKAEYNGEFVVTVTDANAFSIPVEFVAVTGNPGVKGTWQPAAGGSWRKTAAIVAAVDEVAKVIAARVAAPNAAIATYSDSRAPDALELVLAAIVQAAAVAESPLAAQVTALAAQAGRDALASAVVRYPRPTRVPSTDYTAFVRSDAFAASVATAAAAAATAAEAENANIIATPASRKDKAFAAAMNALAPVFVTASRALLTELPMTGAFGSGSTGLQAEIVLPASHPTNPFRHRRHPDHTVGFDIRRVVNLTFQAAADPSPGRAGYGVDRISGTYAEEIFGLHKLLGPERDTGLKVGGTFQLNRISLIDTLNGR